MKKLRLPLLLRVVAALAAMGLLPLVVTYFQLRTNEDALFEQVQRTHIVATQAAATQVDTYLEGLLVLARSTASHPLLLSEPQSSAAQELLRGILQEQPAVILTGIFNAEGANVVMVRRRDLGDEIATLVEPGDNRELAVLQGATARWLRLQVPLPQEAGKLVAIAGTEKLDEYVQIFQIGQEAELVLASRDGALLFGAATTLDSFPVSLVERARAGKLGSGSSEFQSHETGSFIVGHADLDHAPWIVLSRQPAQVAKVAQQRIQQATWLAAISAVLLTALLSGGAYLTVIRPIRRLAAAQRELVGETMIDDDAGSEIDQLEASFELLQQRIRDSEDLGKVFLGRYQVTHLLGSGAMGSVFKGWDPKLKRDLALKTMRVNAEAIDQQKLMTSLMEEAAISARFHHPNIVTVYDVADEGNAAFIAMELVDGTNLEKYLKSVGTLDPQDVILLGSAIAHALAVAHKHGLVHHDVKPANVLLGLDGSIKVTDFGISELISAATRSDDVICGTPGYIAPECFLGEPYGPSADLFALGLILYESLVGKNPFHGRTLRETILNTATVDPEPFEHFRPDVPPELAQLISDLMSKEPADRPSEAATVAEKLDAMVREQDLVWQPVAGQLVSDAGTKAARPTRLVSLHEQ